MRLLAVITLLIFFSGVYPVKEISAQSKVNKSNVYYKFLSIAAGKCEITDFSKKKSEFDNDEIGYPAFRSDCFALDFQADLIGGRYDQYLNFSFLNSGSVRFSEGLTDNRNVDENASSFTHFSLSYCLVRKFKDKVGISYYAGVAGKAVYEKRGIEYFSIGEMRTRDLYMMLGGILSIESPEFYKTCIKLTMNNYFAVPGLNCTMYDITGYGKDYHQKLVRTDLKAGIVYEIFDNKWIRLDVLREEYRSLSISENVSVPRKDSNRIYYYVSYRQPLKF